MAEVALVVEPGVRGDVGDREAGGCAVLHLDLRSGRRRSWHVPKRGYWLEFPLRVQGTLLMLSEGRSTWRLWRAA